jgi:hypothetical protein
LTSSTALAQTAALLAKIPGGAELLDWFGGKPEFADAEIIELRLDRKGPSLLRLAICKVTELRSDATQVQETVVVSFFLKDMIDVSVEGFCRQNVIGGLELSWADRKEIDDSLVGIGCELPDMEIAIKPCAGAFGLIRATIEQISISPPVSPEDRLLWDQEK